MPEFQNNTPFPAELIPLIDKEGRNVVMIVTKGSYELDENRELVPAAEQVPLAFADERIGDPATGPIRVPADIVYFKPSTDVLLIQPRSDEDLKKLAGRKVSVEVGPVQFGGRLADPWPFGPVAPNVKPRLGFAGTYDKAWADNRMPLLPVDFDPRFNQVAPAKQIAKSYLAGDEAFKVTNLYSDGEVMEGKLPGRTIIVSGNVLHDYFTEVAALDTVLVWCDKPIITLVWRHCIRPRQKVAEVCNVFACVARLQATRELYDKP
jgi:hypothetical protein